MGDVIGETMAFAVGVAVSPVPIAAVIVMLFTPRARTNAPSFMVGWVTGLLLVGSVVLLIPGITAGSGEPTTTTGVIKGVLGILLLAAGVGSWLKGPRSGELAEAPNWMDAIDGFGVGKSFGLGFLLSAVNRRTCFSSWLGQ